MRTFLKLALGMIVGFFASYFTLEFFYGNVTTIEFDQFYYWLSILLILLSLGLLIFSFVISQRLLKTAKSNPANINADDLDRYKYNTFNQLTAASTSALIMSLLALAIQILERGQMWLVIASGIIFIIACIVSAFIGGTINSLYPERNLPNPGDKNYADKLFEASDDGEIFVMAKGLYRSTQLTSTLLFFALVAMIFYSIITEDSQVFSIIIIGMIMIVNQIKYTREIKER